MRFRRSPYVLLRFMSVAHSTESAYMLPWDLPESPRRLPAQCLQGSKSPNQYFMHTPVLRLGHASNVLTSRCLVIWWKHSAHRQWSRNQKWSLEGEVEVKMMSDDSTELHIQSWASICVPMHMYLPLVHSDIWKMAIRILHFLFGRTWCSLCLNVLWLECGLAGRKAV